MSEWINKDTGTAAVKRATDFLFVMNPKGTSIGVVFGIVLDGIIRLFEPALKDQNTVDFNKINTFYFIFFGIFVFNIRNAFRVNPLAPQIESALYAIKEAKRKGEVSPAQARLMYLNLYETVLKQITLDCETQEKVKKVSRGPKDVNPPAP
jgi:hypothetical protein